MPRRRKDLLPLSCSRVGETSFYIPEAASPFWNGKGTGLGLAIVHGVVKQTASYISVESQVGRGSRFTVYFPRIASPAVESPPLQPQREAGAAVAGSGKSAD